MKRKFITVIIISIFAAGCLFVFNRFRVITQNTIVNTQKEPSVTYTTLAQRMKHGQPFTILLLGYGGGSHDGTYLTDSIMAVRIDPSKKQAYLLSIPRDLWVPISLTDAGSKHWKINAAYQIGVDDKGYPNKKAVYTGTGGGGKLVEDVVATVLGQTIDRFFAIDFEGFKHTIDTLGGVDIKVETAFDDFAYPLENIPDDSCGHSPDEIKEFTATVSAEQQIWEYFPCRYEHLHFDAGQTHMDGKTALSYVRSRHSAIDGSDFGRAKRQRNLLLAVKAKILSASFIPRILPFMESLGKDLKTDISLDDIKALLQHISEFNAYEIHTYALTDKNFLNQTFSEDGQAILAPKEGIDNWTKIQDWTANIFSGQPVRTAAVVYVENGTKISGLAQKSADRLNKLSVQTAIPKNSPDKTDTTTVTVYDRNISTNDVNIIMKEFGVTSVSYGTHTTDDYNVLVKIGADYSTKLKNETPAPN